MALLGRDTSVTGPFPKDVVVLLESLSGTETLGSTYDIELGLLCKDPNLDPDQVLGKPLSVGIRLDTGGERFFHGVVSEFGKAETTRAFTRYSAKLEPDLAKFRHTFDCCVFNDAGQNAVSIAKDVLAFRDFTDIDASAIKLDGLRVREYCVQYRESDLNFVQRLLEEEGIYYFFRHDKARHTLVLANSLSAHKAAEGYEVIPYASKERRAAGMGEHFWGMKLRKALYPGAHTVLSGYDPTKRRRKPPAFGEKSSLAPTPGRKFEHYDNPGGLCDPGEATQVATIRTQLGNARNNLVEVHGNTLGIGPGALVSLRPYLESGEILPFWEATDLAKQYLVVSATYRLSINQYETGEAATNDEPFRATYGLLDTSTPFLPTLGANKPLIIGAQTALVVGPEKEEIWTDSLGRVKVQFDWDREGEHDEGSSCWVRVSQAWAGPGWGAIHIPRIGQEVVVTFQDGDPDRPLITGRLHNADNMPPYELPANQTQSGIKSRSTKEGTASNFNEIRFEDKKGHEELHVQAERDMTALVKHDQVVTVNENRTVNVGIDQTTNVHGKRTTTVDQDDKKTVHGLETTTVDLNRVLIVTGESRTEITKNATLLFKTDRATTVVGADVEVVGQKVLQQGGTKLECAEGNFVLKTEGWIKITHAGAKVQIDDKGKITIQTDKELLLLAKGTSAAFCDGKVEISAEKEATISVGNNAVKVDATGITTTANNMTMTATGLMQMMAPIITQN